MANRKQEQKNGLTWASQLQQHDNFCTQLAHFVGEYNDKNGDDEYQDFQEKTQAAKFTTPISLQGLNSCVNFFFNEIFEFQKVGENYIFAF